MNAFLLTLVLFAFWGIVGFAFLSLFPHRLNPLQGLLVSPTMGLGITLFPVYFINRAGIPVKDFGGYLFPLLLFVSLILWILKKPYSPFRRTLPFFLLAAIALVIATHPMLDYGFDWFSFGNEDMANYCLGAQRFYNYGFFEKENIEALNTGKDYSQVFWRLYVAHNVRPGAELILAAVWAGSGWNAHQIFMPTIMAIWLTLVFSAASMVAFSPTKIHLPLVAAGLMVLSPLTILGSLQQLIGQLGGLSILCATVTLIFRKNHYFLSLRKMTGWIPAVLVLSGLFIWYPEVLPFFASGFLVYLLLTLYRYNPIRDPIEIPEKWREAVQLLNTGKIIKRVTGSMFGLVYRAGVLLTRQRKQLLRLLIPAAGIMLGSVLFLNVIILSIVLFMSQQLSFDRVPQETQEIAFPYFLIPKGIPITWGLLPLGASIPEPYLSIGIFVGLLLSCWLIRWILGRHAGKVTPPVAVVIVMLLVSIWLFQKRDGYGLFKLAMYSQPFLAGTISIILCENHRRKKLPVWSYLLIALTLGCSAFSQFQYYARSKGEHTLSTVSEIPMASSQKIYHHLEKLFTGRTIPPSQILLSDTPNPLLAKIQALYTIHTPTLFPAMTYFLSNLQSEIPGFSESVKIKVEPLYQAGKLGENHFIIMNPQLYQGKEIQLLTATWKTDIFNDYHRSADPNTPPFVISHTPSNRLVFISSFLGNHYFDYARDMTKRAFFQIENDPMIPGRTFASLGRNFVFMVMGASKNPRLILELSCTVVKQFAQKLPQPISQGNVLGFIGRGSGRMVSAPLELTTIDGHPYLALDIGRDGRQFTRNKKGLMLLYGRDVSENYHWITSFCRDISLLTEEQYQAIRPPLSLQKFPMDLNDKNVEYSGMYEDGWISERAFFILRSEEKSRHLEVRGLVPMVKDPAFHSTVKIAVDGETILEKPLKIGSFAVKLPMIRNPHRHRIDLWFSDSQVLDQESGRLAAARLDFIGFTE